LKPIGVADTVEPLWVTFALYGVPAMIAWPAENVIVIAQLLIGYEELFVTVTVAPKSGGLSDGVCQEIV